MRRVLAPAMIVSMALAMAELCQAAVKIPVGLAVDLELLHHVTAHYTPSGTKIFFRVADNVVVDGQTVIAKGAPVLGRVRDSQERGRVGHSGNMSLDVHSVEAVDGTVVGLDLDLSKQGRSRGAATVGWVVFWGIPGLLTRGVNPYIERGAVVTATVEAEVTADPANARGAAAAPNASDAGAMQISGHKWSSLSKNKELIFDIERSAELGTINFAVEPQLTDLQLDAVDGVAVPEVVRADRVDDNGATFAGWSIVKYCANGPTRLRFSGTAADGKRYIGEYSLSIKIKKKAPKKPS